MAKIHRLAYQDYLYKIPIDTTHIVSRGKKYALNEKHTIQILSQECLKPDAGCTNIPSVATYEVELLYRNNSAAGLIHWLMQYEKCHEQLLNGGNVRVFDIAFQHMIWIYIRDESNDDTLLSCVFLKYSKVNVAELFVTIAAYHDVKKMDKLMNLIEKHDLVANLNYDQFYRICAHTHLEILQLTIKFFERINKPIDIRGYSEVIKDLYFLQKNDQIDFLIELSKSEPYKRFRKDIFEDYLRFGAFHADLESIAKLVTRF